MRQRQRYTVHRRLLLTFLLLGCAGSFVLGQEIARALAEIPVYAAQSLTFSGAGITASLVTPIQVSGAIGQPTPQPKVVKQPSKPAAKPKGKGPSSKPATPHQSPVQSPPIALQGTPVQVPPTVSSLVSPCVSASCLPDVKPAPPVVPPPAAAPTGIICTESGSSTGALDGSAIASPSGAPSLQYAPHGLVPPPASPSHEEADAHCASLNPTNGASSAKEPQPASPGVIGTPVAIDAPLGGLAAPVVNPVNPINPVVLDPATSPTLAAPIQPADSTLLPPAGNNLLSSSVSVATGADVQSTPITLATPATDQQQPQS